LKNCQKEIKEKRWFEFNMSVYIVCLYRLAMRTDRGMKTKEDNKDWLIRGYSSNRGINVGK
jgi:hypothetical protein